MNPTKSYPQHEATARRQFDSAYPRYQQTQLLDELRKTEYARLDNTGQIYLDYTGGGLHANTQLEAHMRLLSSQVFGNPHSHNPTSLAMTELVEQARAYVLRYFNASPDEYLAIFTPNASGALRLVGEAYQFEAGGRYALSFDNHNSVNGIREFARAKHAIVHYLPIVAPELRLDYEAAVEELDQADRRKNNLLAFPAQSNFSGVRHPLTLVAEAHARGWDVLLDCAAFAPTNRCDIGMIQPDFAAFSFYKMFGYPTGLGCLLVRKDKLHKLRRPWFAGGTIEIVSVLADNHYLHNDEAAFEDGTIDYLNIPAIETGLRHLEAVGIDVVHERVKALTGWLIAALQQLRHENERPLVELFGPANMIERGGTITFALRDADGRGIDIDTVEALANKASISLRTGCFCNPGAGEVAHGVLPREMIQIFDSAEPVSFQELRRIFLEQHNRSVGAIRLSLGIASNFSDVYQAVEFLRGLLDRSAEKISRSI